MRRLATAIGLASLALLVACTARARATATIGGVQLGQEAYGPPIGTDRSAR